MSDQSANGPRLCSKRNVHVAKLSLCSLIASRYGEVYEEPLHCCVKSGREKKNNDAGHINSNEAHTIEAKHKTVKRTCIIRERHSFSNDPPSFPTDNNVVGSDRSPSVVTTNRPSVMAFGARRPNDHRVVLTVAAGHHITRRCRRGATLWTSKEVRHIFVFILNSFI
jgi:hypothetical protein